jgi:hypothetical protein
VILSAETSSELKSKLASVFAGKVNPLLVEAKKNAASEPENEQYFKGVRAGLNHSTFLMRETLAEVEF